MTEVTPVQPQATGAEQVLWNLSIFYDSPTDPAIERDMQAVSARADVFASQYRGKVASLSAAEMVAAIQELEALQDQAGRVGSYASLLYATDTINPQYGALAQKVTEFDAEIEQKLIFFGLEWKAVDDAHAQAILDDPALGVYQHTLESDRRYKPHMLSEAEEQILVDKSVTGNSAWQRYFTQLTSSMRYDYNGEKLNQSQILKLMYDPDRSVRAKAANSVTASLRDESMSLTYIFNVLAADKASDDRKRSFPTWISARNLANKAPDAVVEALISAVTSNYEIVARHYRLKRALLGYDELFDYDRYSPLPIKAAERDYSWEEARAIVGSAYSAFSPTLGGWVDRFFDEHWIHAALAPNKRGGAFASPTVPSAHPFVFLNYTGKGRDVMTLAHELGHGLHMALTAETQPLSYVYTPLTTAEMASVFGEMLVFQDLTRREPDPAARLAMLANKLEDSFSTVFRQVSMNRFEHGMHTARRSEGELPTDRLSTIWLETQRAMFGDSVTLRDDYGLWWSYIPHFLHVPGYVYAYAFGELLVLALYNLYQKRGPSFADEYLGVLAAGNSDYPERILAHVGVDLGDPSFWNEGLQTLDALVTQEEQLAREVYPAKFA
ncbi:MAG TPA: M3 family oligoendopeptidase [Candidatus Limnocylindrales bacterium]|nr:M3 family oligoendopeptidase [Candidatus Limnocylindrales bacterium]